MKRWMSFILSLLLLAGLTVPAMAAAESTDARLKRVTELVKQTLELDTAEYTEFSGDVTEGVLCTTWRLRWEGDGKSLNVEALEDGTIVNLWRWSAEQDGRDHALPTFPKVDAAAAKAAAEAFARRVLGKNESVELSESWGGERLNGTSCSFNGTINVNGLSSPMTCSLTVRGSDNAVISFYRNVPAELFIGSIPSASPAVTKDAATETLRGTQTLELIYITAEDAPRAVLRYVLKDAENVCVDAQTGELVHPDGGMHIFRNGVVTEDAAEEETAMPSLAKFDLTEVERAGVEKLEGTLSREELDKKLRGESAFRLDGWTLSSADYTVSKNDGSELVLCTLRYNLSDGDGYVSTRSFLVDARTGALRSIYSSGRWDKERKASVSAADAQKLAEAYLARYSAHASEFALRGNDDRVADGAPTYGFTFARKVNGVFFPEDSCTISIDCASGAVCGLNYSYSEAAEFDAVEGVVSEADALNAWMASYDTVLAYRLLTRELDASVPAEKKLIDNGITQFATLLLSYALERETWCLGVDAKTGAVIVNETTEDEDNAYTDVEGSWAQKEIETLAKYGVGYAGGTFAPDKTLTQWDLVCLIASLQGWFNDPAEATEEERDDAYDQVYSMGALTRAERHDDAVVTRGELVRMLLNCAGLGSVAKLQGVFTCSYTDRASIPADQFGYAALAQGYGLVKSDAYNAGGSATRAMAAAMLYRLMECEI